MDGLEVRRRDSSDEPLLLCEILSIISFFSHLDFLIMNTYVVFLK